MTNKKDIVKSTESGRLFIEIHDFFNQPDVRKSIDNLMASSIFKNIKSKKPR